MGMRMAKRETKRRKTAFVPRIVFATAVVGTGVIPACAAACGGTTNVALVAFPGDDAMGVDGSGRDGVATGLGVGTVAFPGPDVAVTAFDGGPLGHDVAVDAFGGVADVGFGGGEVAEAAFGGVADVGFVAPDASDAMKTD